MRKIHFLILSLFFSWNIPPILAQEKQIIDAKNVSIITSAKRSLWKGGNRYDFKYEGRDAIVVVPKKAASGNPWIWRPAFFDAFASVDEALLNKGFHIAYYDLTHLYGSPRSIQLGNSFYKMMCQEWQLSTKVTLEGFSRGGYFVFNWAAANPDQVACIYVDAPVCDILSWPGRKNSELWSGFLKEWNIQDQQVDSTFQGNALYKLQALSKARIPIISVCGDNDQTVPYTENMQKVRDAYQAEGGVVELILKPGCDHHPHSLTNPEPVVDFILRQQEGYNEKQQIQRRSSLDNAFARFEKEKKGCVAFLGGSITEMKGWRNLIQEDLKRRFPETKFTFIDAGISSTGSTPHAFRLEKDVIQKGVPDLLFVEAAVNDDTNGFTPVEQIRGMEGIVRHALRVNPYMDIVMLHFIYDPFIPLLQEGKQPDVIINHERVANYYRISSINLAQEVAKRMQTGEFSWAQFGGTHPAWEGHKYYAAAIEQLFDEETRPSKERRIQAHFLPQTPLDEHCYDQGELIDVSKATHLKGFNYIEDWVPADKQVGTRQGFVHVPMLAANKPNASFKFTFIGKAIGLFCVAGPRAGILQYSIDGTPFKSLATETKWSKNLYLPWVYMLATELKDTSHTLEVKIAEGEKTECQIRNFAVNR